MITMALAAAMALMGADPSSAEWIHSGDTKGLVQLLEQNDFLVMGKERPGKPTFITAVNLINATPDQVRAVVTDYADQPQFIPQLESTTVHWVNDHENTQEINLKVKFSVIKVGITYTMKNTFDGPYKCRFEQIKGDIKDNHGYWEIVPVDGGKRSLFVYSFTSDLKSMGWLVKYMLEQQPSLELGMQVPTGALFVKAIRRRVENPGYQRTDEGTIEAAPSGSEREKTRRKGEGF